MNLANGPLLEVRRLSISYSHPAGVVRAVCDASLRLFEGEALALVGETGSGKSTLAHAVAGLLDDRALVESGEILFQGRDLRSLDRRDWKRIRGRKIGMVFQDTRAAMNPVLSVGAHFAETIRAHQKVSRREAHTKALDLMREVGIPQGYERRYPFELSGGECQRIGIALAICNKPLLLIADEPTSAVDSTLQAQIMDLIQTLQKRFGLALLLISHDLSLASQVSDQIAVMYHGRIVECGTAAEVLASPAHPYTCGLIRCQPDLSHHFERRPLEIIPGATPAAGEDLKGCPFAPRCGESDTRCRDSLPSVRPVSETHWVSCVPRDGKSEAGHAL